MRLTILVVSVSLAVAILVVACDKSPTQPTPLPTAVNPGVFTNRIELGGPSSVAPGQSAQLTATAHRSDGTTADVTTTANWRTSKTAVLSISPTGLATGQTTGDAVVTVTSGTSASREILVLPPGTYRLVGLVAEADSPTAPIVGAQVEVVGGLPGLSTMTGLDGRYRLYGVPAVAEMRVTKAGYEPVVQRLSLSDHQTQNFPLAPTTARPNLAGTYTLTLSAPAECFDRLPQEVRTRRYTATITQHGPLLDVSLAGATFVVDSSGKGDGFRGRIEPGRVVFTIDYGDFYYYHTGPDIIEEINPSLWLGVSGTVTAAVTPANISGALNGLFFTVIADPRHSFPSPNRFCNSTVHQLVLQR
jgi:hypothetical protein